MTTTPEEKRLANERKAKERADRKALGLKRLELYAHPEDHTEVKEAAAKIARRRARLAKQEK